MFKTQTFLLLTILLFSSATFIPRLVSAENTNNLETSMVDHGSTNLPHIINTMTQEEYNTLLNNPYFVDAYTDVEETTNGHTPDISMDDMIPMGYNRLNLNKQDDIYVSELGTYHPHPFNVGVMVHIVNEIEVKELDEELRMDIIFEIYWRDERLSVSDFWRNNSVSNRAFYLTLPVELMNRLWTPDVYFTNAKSVHRVSLLSNSSTLRIYPAGTLRYSTSISVTVRCEMDFLYYPVDVQKCKIPLRSFLYEWDVLDLSWRPHTVENNIRQNYSDDMAGPNYVTKVTFPQQFRTYKQDSLGWFSIIDFEVSVKRRLSYHLLQTYLPSSILIIVSWLGFFIPVHNSTERMAFSIACLFTMTSMFSAVRESTPTVSYIKALDIWMLACIFFVFINLVEHALIGRAWTKDDPKDDDNSSEQSSNSGTAKCTQAVTYNLANPKRFAKRADLIAFSVLPILFLVFNCGYWYWLLVKERIDK